MLDAASAARLRTLVERAGLPVTAPPGVDGARLRTLMEVDKKSRAGRLRLVLLESIGAALVVSDFDEEQLRQTIDCHLAPGGR